MFTTFGIVPLPLVLGVQLVSLFMAGVYRGVWQYFGLMDGVTFARGVGLGAHRLGVADQRAQRVGDVLECAQHRVLVLRRRLVVGRDRCELLVLESAAAEDRLQQAGADVPRPRRRIEKAAAALEKDLGRPL